MIAPLPDRAEPALRRDADIEIAADTSRAEEEMLRGESIWSVPEMRDFWSAGNLEEVDAENPTGATRLYVRAAMRVIREDVAYEKELT